MNYYVFDLVILTCTFGIVYENKLVFRVFLKIAFFQTKIKRVCKPFKVERQKSVSVTVIVKTTTAVIAVVLCIYCNY